MAVIVDRFVRNSPFAVAAVAGLLFALIACVLFAFPSFIEPNSLGGKPVGYGWLGTDGLRWTYLGLTLIVTGGYAGAALAARRAGWGSSASVGVLIGIVAAFVAGVIGVRSYLLATSPEGLNFVDPDLRFYLWTPVVAGILAPVVTRRLRWMDLAAAVFWASAAFALLNTTIGITRDLVLAHHLMHSAWVGDIDCSTFSGNAVIGCEIAEPISFGFVLLAIVPPTSAALLVLLEAASVGLRLRRDHSEAIAGKRSP